MPLSQAAMQLLLGTGMRRDEDKTCSEQALRRQLRELGLPAYESAIAFELSFGGMVWRRNIWGTCTALNGCTAENLWRNAQYHEQAKYHGVPLLPVGISERSNDNNKGRIEHWISRDGWILLDPGTGYPLIPLAESAMCFFEREALRQGLVHNRPRAILRWREIPTGTPQDFTRFVSNGKESVDSDESDDDDDEIEPRYLSDPQRPIDQQLAETLGLPLYGPASDRCMHVWYDGSGLVFPYRFWESTDRVLHWNRAEDLASMITAAAKLCPMAGVIWEGPLGEAPRPGEDIAAKVASVSEHEEWRGHLLVIGRPGDYRVHEQLFDKPVYIARLWEARREEWEAMQKRRLTR
jgi:hypothetical protein